MLAVMSVLTAQGDTSIRETLSDLCGQVKSVLGVAMFMMIILAAVVYAVGQIMGAETRARASVWATAMFTGAIMAGIILLIAPTVINMLVPDDIVGGEIQSAVCA